MIVLSHRGLWSESVLKNSKKAFQLSFDAGFGTETDVRDDRGELVISHDMPVGGEMRLIEFVELLDGRQLTLALNVKADGLSEMISCALKPYVNVDWFVFDMSVPDQRLQLRAGHPVFTRMSEVERVPIWIDSAAGIWLDAFEVDWFDNDLLEYLLIQGKRVCIVSPDLHGRDPLPLWNRLSKFRLNEKVMICTDRVLEANQFFKDRS
jgi:hypothetical protein